MPLSVLGLQSAKGVCFSKVVHCASMNDLIDGAPFVYRATSLRSGIYSVRLACAGTHFACWVHCADGVKINGLTSF